MVEDRQVAESKSIQRATGKTFHFATRLLPERVRHATYVLYAFFRIADEVVDDAGDRSPAEQEERLEELREQALGEVDADDPVLDAFQEVKREHDIADEEVDVFIDAMKTDISKGRYADYDELEAYMRGSASAVGVMMTDIMDIEGQQYEQALPHAVALGKAFQLSNFLRDVREDIVDRDRIYLPQTTMADHGVTDEQIESFDFDESFAEVIKAELRRTERLYREGVAGIKFLPEDCQFAVLLAAVLYADHHRSIRKVDYDVLNTEPDLGTLRKVRLLAETRWHWTWTKDPEAVFRRVSCVPYTDSEVRHADREHGEPHVAQ